MKLPLYLLLLPLLLICCADDASELLELKQGREVCRVRRSNGVPTAIQGEFWAINLDDGQRLTPDYFATYGRVTAESPVDSMALFCFTDSLNQIELAINLGVEGLDCSLRIVHLAANGVSVAFPARLDADTASLDQVIFPNELGVKLKRNFYLAQPNPKIWGGEVLGVEPLKRIAGIDCIADPAVNMLTKVRMTEAAKQVFDEQLLEKWQGRTCRVVRPSVQRPEYDFVTSDRGSYWGGHRVGLGLLLRLGGKVVLDERGIVLDLVFQTLQAASEGRIANYTTGSRRKVGLIDIAQCPRSTGWSEISVDEWRGFLTARCADFVSLRSPEELMAFLSDDATLAIINPYGEMLPVGGVAASTIHDSMKEYLERGGIWTETGGYPFFNTLSAQTYNSLSATYPFGFSDFMALRTEGRDLILYGIQPRDGFVPMNFRTWADTTGAHVSREWRLFVDRKRGGTTGMVRFVFDGDLRVQIDKYARANGFNKPLSEKMPCQTLEVWRKAPLMKLSGGTLREQAACATALPTPSIVHVWDFLKGGFDKLYPDHLPPHPSKGSMDDFKALIDATHARGHLFMPYTNNTWWCDAPASEVLHQYGDEALFRDRNGNPVKEDYAGNYGWSISPYHPKVEQVAADIAREFSNLGCDILFEDQVGAREWIGYDFNPASPSPSAYYQGIINLADTASRYRPLATEQGYDRLINCQSEFCGLTWMLVPFKERPWWVSWWLRSYSDLFDETCYEAYPLAQYVTRGNAFFTHHLGGPLVETSENLAWTLLLGYQIIIDMPVQRELTTGRKQWIELLTDLQREFGPLYMGRPMLDFEYLEGSGNSGVILSRFEGMSVVANFSNKPYCYQNQVLAPKGFVAESKRWVAGNFQHEGYRLIDKMTHNTKRYGIEE